MSDTEVNTNPYGYDDLSSDELRVKIANLNKEIIKAKADKKEFLSGVNDVIKECTTRLESAVAQLQLNEQEEAASKLDEQATKILELAVDKTG